MGLYYAFMLIPLENAVVDVIPNNCLFFTLLRLSQTRKNQLWEKCYRMNHKIPHFQSISSVYIGQFSCY